MIIEIEDELFAKVLQIVKGRSLKVHKKLTQLQALTAPHQDTLTTARTIKTQRVKQSIKEAIKKLREDNIKVSRYQVHKLTGVAYATLKKYYDEIVEEVENER